MYRKSHSLRPPATLSGSQDHRAPLIFCGMIAVALYFCYLLLRPFLTAIAFAVVLTTVFYPVYASIRKKKRTRNFAAGLSTIIVALVFLAPAFLILRQIAVELSRAYQSVGAGALESLWSNPHLNRWWLQAVGWMAWLTGRPSADISAAILGRAEGVLVYLMTRSGAAIRGTAAAIPEILVAFFVLFFLFRDGRSLSRRLAVVFPAGKLAAADLFRCVHETLVATFYGVVAVAAVQGMLAYVAFVVLRLPSPFLWATATGLFALIPVVGTTAVFVPMIAFLFLNGDPVLLGGRAAESVSGCSLGQSVNADALGFGHRTSCGQSRASLPHQPSHESQRTIFVFRDCWRDRGIRFCGSFYRSSDLCGYYDAVSAVQKGRTVGIGPSPSG